MIKLSLCGILKPYYSDNENSDYILKIFNRFFLFGYFQSTKWTKHMSNRDHVLNLTLSKHLNPKLAFRNIELNQICMHIRHLAIDTISNPLHYQYKLMKFKDKVPNIYIAAENKEWKNIYFKLNNDIIDFRLTLQESENLEEDIYNMVYSNIFVAAQSTLSDWIVFIRNYKNLPNLITCEYNFLDK
jgi:hypothetical protein